MSRPRSFRRGRGRLIGATAIVAVAVVSLLALGASSGRLTAQHRSGDASAAGIARSSTHLLARAQRHASLGSHSSSRIAHHSVLGRSSSLSRSSGPASSSASRSLSSVVCGSSNSIAAASGFEDADGNLAVDTAGCTDWNSFSPTWTGTAPFQTGTATLGALSFYGLTDAVNSSSDTIYSGGVKQDTVCPGVTTGSANDKADLARMYVATETINGHVYLFLAWERQLDTTVNSDVFVSFEFDQGQLACANNDGFVQRTKGDLLFDYNFQSGNSTIDAQEWDGSTWQALSTPPFEAAVNTPSVSDTIGPNGTVTLTQYEFGEAGLDLSALNLTGNGGKACETFGSVLGGSRTSKSGDQAQLKDYAGPAPINVSNCVSPKVDTTLHNNANGNTIANNSSVPLGTSIYDTASFESASLITGKNPTGTFNFTFFANGDCSGNGTAAGTGIALNGHSSVEGPLTAGDYSFEAQYIAGSDQNYSDSAPSACEPFTVSKASSTTATVVKDHGGTVVDAANPAALGSKVHDTATVTATPVTATGTVTYQLYSGLTCHSGSELGTAEQVTLSGGAVPNSSETASLAAGSYSYQAIYSGDSNYTGSTGACEPFKIAQAASSTATIVKDHSGTVVDAANPAALGSKVHDTATVTASPFTATGTVTYHLFNGLTCTAAGEIGSGQQVTLSGGLVPDSPETATLAAGSYSYQAIYSGDGNYTGSTGACEPFKIAQAASSTATVVKDHSGAVVDVANPAVLGSKVHDTATVTATPFTATGTVTYQLYGGLTCHSGSELGSAQQVTLSGGSAPNSPETAALAAGSYSYQAIYSGDGNYTGSTGACEPFAVSKNTIAVSTTLSAASPISTGDTVHDSATLSGASATAGGTISYALYDNDMCTGTPVADLTPADNTVTDGVAPNSKSYTFDSAGTFYFQATYSGDSNNTGPVSSPCTSETMVVNAPEIHIVKTADAAQVNAGEPIGFTLTVSNAGLGDAKDVTLTDTLPVKAGLVWSIDAQGLGWAGTCSISPAGVLGCGPVTVPAGTTQAHSTFTVHITSPTTAATGGVCPEGSGLIGNTGDVSTSNGGSDESSDSTCVAAAAVSISKTADHSAPVHAGDQIGFTVEVKNIGTGDATTAKLVDPLPAGSGSGVTWAIDTATGTPAQFVLSGAKGSQTLSLASGTVPVGADYTVHLVASTSQTECGTYDNTATLTTGNGNNPSPVSASESCAYRVDLSITKSGAPNPLTLGAGNITWTIVVTNNGPDNDTGVTVADPMPGGNTFVSASSTKGSCTGGAILQCAIGPMAAGESVTITLVTTPSTTGDQVNTATTVGDRPETNTANNTATATVVVEAPFTPPPVYCIAVSRIAPSQLFVGRKTTLTIHVTQHNKAVSGIRVRVKGPKLSLTTKRSNARGIVKQTVKMKKAGILVFTPVASKACGTKRVGITGVFTPPVTG